MQKLAKGFLLALSAVAALMLLGIIAINLYVQSRHTRARIEQELSAALHLPVQLKSITLTPLHGLKISGVTMAQPEAISRAESAGAANAGNFLEASSFVASFKWAPLLEHQLVIDQIAVNDPKVAWLQDENGKWRLPNEEKKPEPNEAAPKPPKEPSEKSAEPKERKPPEVTINRLQIHRGSFAFLDQSARPVVTFSDIEVTCPSVSTDITQGEATSAKVSVHNNVFFDDVHIPFTFTSGDLSLRGIQANFANGELRGNLDIDTDAKRSPFTLGATFDHVDLNRLLTDTGAFGGRASGSLSGWLELYGNAGKPESLGGRGQLALSGGQLQYDFFQLLGQAVQIDELSQLQLQQAEADFRVEKGFVWVDRLLLQSQNLQLQANGTVRLDGKLKLAAQLTVGPRISRRMPGFIAAYFQPSPETPDARVINFPITGTISKPQTDLVDRIVGGKIQKEMTSLIQNIFVKPKKEKKKKPDSAAGEPSSQAAESSAAAAGITSSPAPPAAAETPATSE